MRGELPPQQVPHFRTAEVLTLLLDGPPVEQFTQRQWTNRVEINFYAQNLAAYAARPPRRSRQADILTVKGMPGYRVAMRKHRNPEWDLVIPDEHVGEHIGLARGLFTLLSTPDVTESAVDDFISQSSYSPVRHARQP